MIDDTRVLSKRLALSLAGVLFIVTLIIVLLFAFGKGLLPPHYSPIVKYFVYLSGFAITPLLMYMGTKSSAFKLVAIVWYHLTLAVLLLWFSEVFSPYTVFWSILILLASIYYGWIGFTVSSLSLVGAGVAYLLLFFGDLRPNAVIYSGNTAMVVMMTILLSYIFVNIISNSRKKAEDLQRSQHSERLQVNRLNTLLNSISDAVMTLNRYGRVTSQNAAAQAFFDTNESLIGRNIDQILKLTDLDNKSVDVTELARSIKTSSMRDDLSTGKSGDVRHLSLQMSRIRGTFNNEEEYGVVLIIRDITKQKSLEEEKDEFISVTSHELRTPVAIAEGSLSNLMLMQERKVSEIKIHDAAEAAHAQVVYLANMINDLSTLSRAERGIGDFIEEVNVNTMLHDLYGRYENEAHVKSLQLNLDAETNLPSVQTSRLYLEEILQNFITNAIKYTKQGSVTFGAKMESDSRIRFFVTDSGIGMSKADIDHIFEKFYRSEDYRTRETTGTGLGLYVVAKLAEKLSTKIDVDSRLNHGSTFSIVLTLKTNRSVDSLGVDQVREPAADTENEFERVS